MIKYRHVHISVCVRRQILRKETNHHICRNVKVSAAANDFVWMCTILKDFYGNFFLIYSFHNDRWKTCLKSMAWNRLHGTSFIPYARVFYYHSKWYECVINSYFLLSHIKTMIKLRDLKFCLHAGFTYAFQSLKKVLVCKFDYILISK